jgi:hypothetical protein
MKKNEYFCTKRFFPAFFRFFPDFSDFFRFVPRADLIPIALFTKLVSLAFGGMVAST